MLLISLVNPHVLLLDEPTNHLDMQPGLETDVSMEQTVDLLCSFFCSKCLRWGPWLFLSYNHVMSRHQGLQVCVRDIW